MNKAQLPFLAGSDYQILRLHGDLANHSSGYQSLLAHCNDTALIDEVIRASTHEMSYQAIVAGQAGLIFVLEFMTLDSDGDDSYPFWPEGFRPTTANVVQYVARRYAPVQSQFKHALIFVSQGPHTPAGRVTVNAFVAAHQLDQGMLDHLVESLLFDY